MIDDPLRSTLLDLDQHLGGQVRLCIGGGYGLYLKQLHLYDHPEIRTLMPLEDCPAARTTQDIDLFLRAEIVADSKRMALIRKALDDLHFQVIPSAKYMQFVKAVNVGAVKIDLLAGPLGEFVDRVEIKDRRVKPIPGVGLHARRCDEAVGIEEDPITIQVDGTLSTGARHSTLVHVPQAFTYLLMKLLAFRDKLQDANKDLGRHHALDLYRIVALLTEQEDEVVHRLSEQYRDHPSVLDARQVVATYFADDNLPGMLRLREHPLARRGLNLGKFRAELHALFPPPA
jgi:hypothetical protein